MITDINFYLFAIPVILLYGMAKGGLGPGVGAICVPLLSFVMEPMQAAAIMLPILCVMDIFAVYHFRRNFDFQRLAILIPSGIVGIILASLLMGQLPADGIRSVIGVIVIVFCFDYWFRKDGGEKSNSGKISGFFWGTLAGFTSTQIHAGGPPVSIYLLPQKLDKVVLMGTMAIFFAVMNYLKLIPYTLMGALHIENIMTSVLLMPLAPIGVRLGNIVLYRVRQQLIYRFLYIALFVSGLKLLYDGFF
ncbi:MAG: sulfite exporter TauE/SafE family protein [Desulfobulbaceae bacterium]|nr:sulfite exporter TauE/SafE family protein [Desulfobulbaceae bacterium]